MSKYLDISLRHFEEQGQLPATSLSCALRDLGGGWRDPVLAYADGTQTAVGYALGSLGAVRLTAREVQLYRLLQGQKQAYLLDCAGVCFGAANRGRIRRSIMGDSLKLAVPVYIVYSLYDAPPGPDAAEQLRQDIAALLRKLQAAGCDALGFGCLAVRSFSTLPDWLQSGWRQRFTSLKIDVTVDARPRQQPLLQHRLTFHGRYGIIQSRKRKSSTGTCPVCFLRVLGNTRGCGLHPRRFHLAKERNGPPLLRLCGAHAGAVSQGCRLCPGSFTGVGGASRPSAP